MQEPESEAFRLPSVRFYPERADIEEGLFDQVGRSVLGAGQRRVVAAIRPVRDWSRVSRAKRLIRRFARMNASEAALQVLAVHERLRRNGLTPGNAALGVAMAATVAEDKLGVHARPVQLLGALHILDGHLIEMDTGEGKTLTAALAAATAALAGIPTHVITVNDYLAERDTEALEPLYSGLGLTVSKIVEGQTREERRAVYAADIVYSSNNEIAFDYLRDRIAFGPEGPIELKQRLRRITRDDAGGGEPPVMRGLHFAIVDEADSVLVDEARTPLIISRQSDPGAEAEWAGQALEIAGALERDRDFAIVGEDRRVQLLERGKDRIQERCAHLDGLWLSPLRREGVIHQALTALYIFKRGVHYLVSKGKVQIVDEYTGRLQPDRSWSDGLHQLIEVKEGVEVTGQNLAIARITYQRFFKRYLKLAGMTGTAREVTGELQKVYRLDVQRIPPHKPSRLTYHETRVFRTKRQKWKAVTADAQRELSAGRPVLIGTRSVSASQEISAALAEAGIAHCVLNAENDHEEAEIIAEAGTAGRVTVATNMAGRGVDIRLAEGVATAGGLHVILTERHDAGRIDRQLAGRSGRRGEPGTAATILSLEDPLLEVLSAPLSKLLLKLPFVTHRSRARLFDLAQSRAERSHARMRLDLVSQDRRLGSLLAFTGGLE